MLAGVKNQSRQVSALGGNELRGTNSQASLQRGSPAITFVAQPTKADAYWLVSKCRGVADRDTKVPRGEFSRTWVLWAASPGHAANEY